MSVSNLQTEVHKLGNSFSVRVVCALLLEFVANNHHTSHVRSWGIFAGKTSYLEMLEPPYWVYKGIGVSLIITRQALNIFLLYPRPKMTKYL